MCGRATAVETVACTIGLRLMATRLNARHFGARDQEFVQFLQVSGIASSIPSCAVSSACCDG
jgi:hypothetical protein